MLGFHIREIDFNIPSSKLKNVSNTKFGLISNMGTGQYYSISWFI